MKAINVALVLTAACLFGCASNQHAVDKSFSQAELSQKMAGESVDSSKISDANKDLDSAKVLKDQGEDESAMLLADKSSLEFRLAVAAAERDALKKEDERVEGELRSDVERKLLYQNILDNEVKGAK